MNYDGKERRQDRAEEYGYLKASVENNTKAIEDLTSFFKKHSEEEERHVHALASDIQELKDEINFYKSIVRVTKGLGATILLVAAFKFGDVAEIWRNM